MYVTGGSSSGSRRLLYLLFQCQHYSQVKSTNTKVTWDTKDALFSQSTIIYFLFLIVYDKPLKILIKIFRDIRLFNIVSLPI